MRPTGNQSQIRDGTQIAGIFRETQSDIDGPEWHGHAGSAELGRGVGRCAGAGTFRVVLIR